MADSGCVGAWLKEEKLASAIREDASGEGNDLANGGTQALATTTDAAFGARASAFDGGNNSSLTRTDANLSATFPGKSGYNATAFTVGCWVKPAVGSGSSTFTLMHKGGTCLQFYWLGSGDFLQAIFFDSAVAAKVMTTSAASVPEGAYTFCAVRLAAGKIAVWSGSPPVKGTELTCADLNDSTDPFLLGAQVGGTLELDGHLDDCFAFSRGLEESELTTLASGGLAAFLATFEDADPPSLAVDHPRLSERTAGAGRVAGGARVAGGGRVAGGSLISPVRGR